MGFWQRLLSIRTDGEVAFRSFDVSLRGWSPLLWTLGVTLLVGFAVLCIYWFESQKLTTGKRLLLAGLRLFAAFVLCLFVFRPFELSAVFEGERPRDVVMLIDDTQSMLRQDERPTPEDELRVALGKNLIPPDANVHDKSLLANLTPKMERAPQRLELVRDVLLNPRLGLEARLEEIGPVQRYRFGHQPHRLVSADTQIDHTKALTGTGPRTALADSLNALLLEGDVDLPTAVFVVTDGNDNASGKDLHRVAEAYRKLGVPLHIYGVGSTRGTAVELIEAKVPDTLFVGDSVGVPIRWSASGKTEGKVRFSVMLGDEEVGSKVVDFQEGINLSETVSFVPKGEEGKERSEKLSVKVEVVGRPELSDGVSQPVRIVDTKIKVLYIEGMPRWEYKFIQRALLRDRRVEAKFLLTEADAETRDSGHPYLKEFPKQREDLFAFNLIFLGDVKAATISGQRMTWLREFVERGGGLVHLAGQVHAPAEFVGTALEEMLPVTIRPQRFTRAGDVRTEGFQPQLSRYGRRSDMLALDDAHEKNLQIWDDLPSLFWTYPVEGLKGGAIALLEHPTEKAGDEAMPMLAQHRYGKGQVLFVGFSETWRWRFNEGEKYHNRFWGQIVYQLGLGEGTGDKRSRLALDRSRVYLGQEGRLFGHFVDEQFRPVEKETIPIEIEQLDGPASERKKQQTELRSIPGVPGEYHAFLANGTSGRFAVRIPDQPDVEFEYRVEVPPNHELAKKGLDETRLRDAAKTSGGAFYREEDLHRLGSAIERRTKTFQVRPTVPLLNPLTFLLFLGILTSEWILRKFSNLS